MLLTRGIILNPATPAFTPARAKANSFLYRNGLTLIELTMVLLTIPLFFPIVVALGFDPVWFGVLIVMVIQIGLISPPVGMNLFVINTLLPRVGLGNIFRGVWSFVLVQVIMLAILVAFPQLSLWLPSFMD